MPQQITISDAEVTACCDRLRKLAAEPTRFRVIVGIAGIPGSGKSTLCEQLVATMNLTEPGIATQIPMDGFHLSNAELQQQGLLEKKGAPNTFDCGAYVDTLRRARERINAFAFPIYDRQTHQPIVTEHSQLTHDSRIVITEGNYLLLRQPPWHDVSSLLNVSGWIDCPIEVAHRRLIARHTKGGRDIVSAEQHYQRTDFPNAQLAIECSTPADLQFSWRE